MKKKKSISKKSKKKDKKTSVNVNQVIQDADAAMESLEMERARSLYSTACTILQQQQQELETNPVELARILLKLGEVKVALEDPSGARQDFERAILVLKEHIDQTTTLETREIRASLYLYLGQLSSNLEALAAARNGIQELQATVRLREQLCEHHKGETSAMETDNDENDKQALQETKRQLSRAYCTVADLYLTDLCFEENAEQECEAAVTAANIIMDEPLVDTLQTMASLRLSQGQGTEAAKCMLQAYAQLRSGCEALAALVGLAKKDDQSTHQGAVELTDVDAANNLPPFDFRCQTAKILMECATVLKSEQSDESSVQQQIVECSDAAIQVLASLLAENDEVIEVWYLMGCAFTASSPPDVDTAAQYWIRALELLTRMKDHMELVVSHDDETQENPLDEINIQIEEVQNRLKEIGHELRTHSADVEMCT